MHKLLPLAFFTMCLGVGCSKKESTPQPSKVVRKVVKPPAPQQKEVEVPVPKDAEEEAPKPVDVTPDPDQGDSRPNVEENKAEAKAFKPRLKVIAPMSFVGGRLNRKGVERKLKSKSKHLLACYREEVKKNPKAAGMLRLMISVNRNGTINSLNAQFSGIGDMKGCAEKHIKPLRFGRPRGGDAMFMQKIEFFMGP